MPFTLTWLPSNLGLGYGLLNPTINDYAHLKLYVPIPLLMLFALLSLHEKYPLLA